MLSRTSALGPLVGHVMHETDIPQYFSADLPDSYHLPYYSGSGFLPTNTVVRIEHLSFDVLALTNMSDIIRDSNFVNSSTTLNVASGDL